MTDTSMTKTRIVVMAFIWFAILGISVLTWKFWWAPKQQEIAQQQQEQQEKEVLEKTSSQSRYSHEINFAMDGFSGYSLLRSQTFRDELGKYGIRLMPSDDKANYTERLSKLQSGQTDMAVFTIDALYKASAELGELPATIVDFIDETKGADAMVGPGGMFPNIDSLNDPDLKIVCTPDSPSETLARVVMAYFNLNQLSENNFEFVDGAAAVYDAYKNSKPTDKKVFILWQPYVSKILVNSDYHVIVDSSKFSGYIVDVIVARRDFLLKNEDVVLNVIKSYRTTLFEHRRSPDMVSLVISDAQQLGESVTEAQAVELVDGIWWKNTQESFGHFGLTSGTGLQHIEDICNNISRVLIKTGAISSDPTNGQPNRLYYDGVVRKLFDTSWHPGFAQETVRKERTLAVLTDEEWGKLKPVGTLQVPRLVFARGTAKVSERSYDTLDQLADKLKTWPQYYLVVRGNVSATGNVEANRKLAQERADDTIEYLLSKGVARQRIHSETSNPNGSSTVAFILGEVPY